MATAARVANLNKPVERWRTDKVQSFVTTEVNGRESKRELVADGCRVVPETHYEPTPDSVVLTLTLEEAYTLRLMAANTGGHSYGRRGDVASIGDALAKLGFSAPISHPDLETGTAIRFRGTRTPFPGVKYGYKGETSLLAGTGASSIGGGCAAPSLLRPAVSVGQQIADASKVATTLGSIDRQRAQQAAQKAALANAMYGRRPFNW